MDNKHSRVPSTCRSSSDQSERSSPPSVPGSKKNPKQCPALSALAELLPSLINSEVHMDDLIDVAETFVKLLKQIKRLQHNASGQRDYADDESHYYFACYPKTDDYRCQSSFHDDNMKKSHYGCSSEGSEHSVEQGQPPSEQADSSKPADYTGSEQDSIQAFLSDDYQLKRANAFCGPCDETITEKSSEEDEAEKSSEEDEAEKSSEEDDNEELVDDDFIFFMIRKVASAPESRPNPTSMNSDDVLASLFNADEKTVSLSSSTSHASDSYHYSDDSEQQEASDSKYSYTDDSEQQQVAASDSDDSDDSEGSDNSEQQITSESNDSDDSEGSDISEGSEQQDASSSE